MRKLILILSAAFLFVLNAAGQNRTISGKVTDEKGAPAEGVSVTSSDGKQGTQTDKNGNYSISVPPGVRSLSFTSVNYESVSRTIGNQTTINVTMRAKDSQLEEVVVVGYGTQQKKAFTGSASKVDTREFAQLITPSVDRQLAGRAAGVNVNVSGGQVNAPARIRIRGTNSFSQGLSPLVVVDGTPITTGNLALISNSNQTLGDLNPDDIESIDVLKDGSATAIYGSRAANGVIVVTTKKGAKGRNSITYTGTFGFSSPTQRFKVLNAQEFVTIANEKFINAGQLPTARMDAQGTNTDWQSNVFVENALSTNHTLAVSGGTDKTTYYMSLGYADTRGIVRTNRNTAYRIRMNVESQVNKWFKIGNNLGVSRANDFDQNNTSNALSGAIVGALRALPNVGIYNPSHPTGYNLAPGANALGPGNNLRTIDDNYTNIAFVLDNNRYQSDQYRILDNAYIEINFAKGLKLHSQFGYDYYTDNSQQILDPRHGDGASNNGVMYQGQQNITNTNIQNYLNYNLTVKGHSIFLTAGHEIQQTTTRFFAAQGINISDFFYLKENIITNTAGTPSISGNYSKAAIESFFGRLNYDYKGRYFVQGSIRRDGQSSLAPGYKYGNFPGASIGWRPVQENFWRSLPWLGKNVSEFKIKASYAVVGNRLGGFPYLSTYGSRPYGNLGGLAVAVVGNPDLQWEQNKKYDIGVELGLFRNRLNILFDYFKNDLDKLVLDVPTPYSVGIPGNSISQNIGRVQNKGIELSIDATVVRTKNFEWNINANYTHVKNKIISLFSIGGVETKELFPSNYNINRVGESINSLYGYQFAGVNAGNGNPVYYNKDGKLVQRNVSNGTYYFANSLNDPTLGAVTTLTSDDKKIIGSAQPTDFGAFTNTFRYKAFTLDVMFRYQMGNKIMNITRQEILLNQKFANSGREMLERWTTPGQVTNVPKVYYNSDQIINQNGEATTRFVEKGDFLRLQNIVFSYDLDSKRLQSMTNNAVKNARFFLQAQNVYVWKTYKGIDPEAYSENGQDNSISPPVRNISFGVSVGF